MDNLIRVKKLDFVTIEFYDTYVICIINEGVIMDITKTNTIHKESRNFYNGLKYGFIFDRTVDFTIDPTVYLNCPYYGDISALYVVVNSARKKQMIDFEQNFTKFKISIYSTMEEARGAMSQLEFGIKAPLVQ